MATPDRTLLTRRQRFRIEFGRWWYHRVHRLTRRKVTPESTVRQILLAFVYIAPILFTTALTWEEKKGPIIWLAVMYVIVQLWRAYGELQPRGWDEAREHYIDRKHQFGSVIRRLAAGDPALLDHTYQRDCLWLIANYVRAWRWDLRAERIFANLLIEDPKDQNSVIVVARDLEDRLKARPIPKPYRKEERLISECFNSGTYNTTCNEKCNFFHD